MRIGAGIIPWQMESDHRLRFVQEQGDGGAKYGVVRILSAKDSNSHTTAAFFRICHPYTRRA